MKNSIEKVFKAHVSYKSKAYMESHLFEPEHCPVFGKLSKKYDLVYTTDADNNNFQIQFLGSPGELESAILDFCTLVEKGEVQTATALYWLPGDRLLTQRLDFSDVHALLSNVTPVFDDNVGGDPRIISEAVIKFKNCI